MARPYYQDEWATIYHGDSREFFGQMRKHRVVDGQFTVVVTDPPYGVSGEQNTRTAERRGGRKNAYTMFDDSPQYVSEVVTPVIWDLVEDGYRVVVTPGNRCLVMYPMPDSFGAIYQPASVGLQPWGRADAQPILYYGKCPYGGKALPGRKCSFVSTGAASAGLGHPCPKPESLWAKIVGGCTVSGDVVLDPFMGSGTTLVVAKTQGLKSIGIEIEERYCEMAANRLAQGVLWEADVKPCSP